jgi:hypothetical protein
MHAQNDPRETSARGRQAFMNSFYDGLPEDLSDEERERRADQARKAYFAGLAYKSAKARRQRKSVDATNAGPNNRRSSKSESPSDASRA